MFKMIRQFFENYWEENLSNDRGDFDKKNVSLVEIALLKLYPKFKIPPNSRKWGDVRPPLIRSRLSKNLFIPPRNIYLKPFKDYFLSRSFSGHEVGHFLHYTFLDNYHIRALREPIANFCELFFIGKNDFDNLDFSKLIKSNSKTISFRELEKLDEELRLRLNKDINEGEVI